MKTFLLVLRPFLKNESGSVSWGESFALKAVSLLLALILWITILGFKKEELEKRVPLKPLHSPDVMITNEIPTHITFVLSGPRVLLKKVENTIGPVQPDYRHAQEGVVGFPIREDLVGELPSGVRVTSYSPALVQLHLEKVVQKTFPVRPTLEGEVPEGWEISVSAVPNHVTVLGPRSVIETMSFVSTSPVRVGTNKGVKTTDTEIEVDEMQKVQLLSEKNVQVTVKLFKKKSTAPKQQGNP